MTEKKRKILLAYAPRYLSTPLKGVLEEEGYQVDRLERGSIPKGRFEIIIGAARNPADLAEWTRDLLNKAEEDGSRFFMLSFRTDDHLYEEAARFARSLTEEFERKKNLSANVLRLSRLYGPGVPPEESGSLGHLIGEFQQKEFLTVYAEGKDCDYYLFINDAVEGIRSGIASAKAGEEYAVSPAVPVSSEAIAKLLFELGEGRHEIRFHRGLTAAAEKGKVAGSPLPNFKPQTSFRDGVMAMLKEEPPSLEGRERRRIPKFNIPRIKFPAIRFQRPPALSKTKKIVLGLLLVLLSPVLYAGIEGGAAFYHLVKAREEAGRFDFASAEKSIRAAEGSFGRLKVLIPPAEIGEEIASGAGEVLAQGEALNRTLENLINSYQGEGAVPQTEEELTGLAASLGSAGQTLTIAWLKINQLSSPWDRYFDGIGKVLHEEVLPALETARAFAGEAYDLLGYKGERSYLLLFLNSAEIHPGGGRMGTFAHLKLINGGIAELKFFNESDFLHIPSGSRTASGAVSLRPDFQDNAQTIADIFKKGEEKTARGVIGIDLHFAQNLLGVTGPLRLAEFNNQEVNEENFFEVTTREVETDFFPGTTKKKAFIQALGEGVLARLFGSGREKYFDISQLVWQNLSGKGILLYFTNPALYSAVLENNFAGRIREAEGDYLYPFDHNSGTKGTVWVKRSIRQRVYNSDREGALRAELQVTWKNEGTEAWPGGEYFNKTAVMAPLGSELVEVRYDDQDVLDNFITGSQYGKTLFYLPYDLDTYVPVSPGESKTMTMIYNLPDSVGFEDRSYTLLIQKQPGTVADPVEFVFETPLGWEASSPDLQKQDNRLIFEGSLTKDLEFEITLKER